AGRWIGGLRGRGHVRYGRHEPGFDLLALPHGFHPAAGRFGQRTLPGLGRARAALRGTGVAPLQGTRAAGVRGGEGALLRAATSPLDRWEERAFAGKNKRVAGTSLRRPAFL